MVAIIRNEEIALAIDGKGVGGKQLRPSRRSAVADVIRIAGDRADRVGLRRAQVGRRQEPAERHDCVAQNRP
jgi:hypothetical protein